MTRPAATTVDAEPVLGYPSEAEVGRAYLVTVDLRPAAGSVWPATAAEELSAYCLVAADGAAIEPLGEPTVVMHRFGGSYGPARFVLTPTREGETRVEVLLSTAWGEPIASIRSGPVRVREIGAGISTRDRVEVERGKRAAGGATESTAGASDVAREAEFEILGRVACSSPIGRASWADDGVRFVVSTEDGAVE